MQPKEFCQVDVFTQRPLLGNPVAVFLDADDFDGESMQRIARWTNLSETTFVLKPRAPEASYRLRIFTPRQELPFAGHPSVGTAHALLEAGRIDPADGPLLQECAAGLLPLRIEGAGSTRIIHVRAPRARLQPVVEGDCARLGSALGAMPQAQPPPQVVDNGPHWWVAAYDHGDAVRALRPDMHALATLTLERGAVGVAVFGAQKDGEAQLVVRCFCPADGIPEDPVTGSGNAAIAAFLRAHDRLPGPRYIASQGREIGRDGLLHMSVDAEDIELGGACVTVLRGHAWLR
jgi:PhzF family phenazine biosynthesis protein